MLLALNSLLLIVVKKVQFFFFLTVVLLDEIAISKNVNCLKKSNTFFFIHVSSLLQSRSTMLCRDKKMRHRAMVHSKPRAELGCNAKNPAHSARRCLSLHFFVHLYSSSNRHLWVAKNKKNHFPNSQWVQTLTLLRTSWA